MSYRRTTYEPSRVADPGRCRVGLLGALAQSTGLALPGRGLVLTRKEADEGLLGGEVMVMHDVRLGREDDGEMDRFVQLEACVGEVETRCLLALDGRVGGACEGTNGAPHDGRCADCCETSL